MLPLSCCLDVPLPAWRVVVLGVPCCPGRAACVQDGGRDRFLCVARGREQVSCRVWFPWVCMWGVTHLRTGMGDAAPWCSAPLQVPGWDSVGTGHPSMEDPGHRPVPPLGAQEEVTPRMLSHAGAVWGTLGAMGLLRPSGTLSLLPPDSWGASARLTEPQNLPKGLSPGIWALGAPHCQVQQSLPGCPLSNPSFQERTRSIDWAMPAAPLALPSSRRGHRVLLHLPDSAGRAAFLYLLLLSQPQTRRGASLPSFGKRPGTVITGSPASAQG